MRYYEINETAAARARSMWSFTDYQHGSKTAEYRAAVDNAYNISEYLFTDKIRKYVKKQRNGKAEKQGVLNAFLYDTFYLFVFSY